MTEGTDEGRAQRQRVEEALTDAAFSAQVELVVSRLDEQRYRAASHRGSVEFRRIDDGSRWRYEVATSDGVDPLAVVDPDRFLGLDVELAAGFPTAEANSYPYAHDQIAQFFDASAAPDLAVIHTASHHFHGNLGEHGSLGVVQARAPFLAAGPGIRPRGLVDGHARMVDVAPTLATLAGCPPTGGCGPTGARRDDAVLGHQDGDPITAVLDDDERPDHVVAFLWDGTNANALHAAIDAGEAPHAAALLARGTGLRGGVLASLPTATLANHTTALTGAHPGHSGVLHNVWLDRASGEVHDLLQLEAMVQATQHLAGGVETVHEAVHRTFPGAFTCSTYEYCDRGADWSSFRELAAGRHLPFPRSHEDFPRDGGWWERSAKYRWMSRVDEASERSAVARWSGTDHPLPRFCWVNLSLTDEASHEGGPHSDEARAAIRDTDARMGRILAAVERAGVIDRTAVVLMADHGMQTTDPDNTAGYDAALAGCGVAVQDVAEGFLYLSS